MRRNKLKLGLLIHSWEMPAWAYMMIQRIAASDYAEIAVIVLDDTPKVSSENFIAKALKRHANLLYILYSKIEKKLFKVSPDAFKAMSIKELVPDVSVVKVTPRQTKYSDWIEGDDIKQVKTHQVDIFIRLGFRILRGEILKVAKYGIWSYHHGDSTVNRGGPAGFWEVWERHPVTGSILQILGEDLDNGLVLAKSFSGTDPISVTRNRNNLYWKSLSLLLRSLQELHELGETEFFRKVRAANEHIPFYDRPLYREPTNGQFIRHFIRYMAHCLVYMIAKLLYFDQWILLYRLQDGISDSFWRFKKIVPPTDRFWADPHIIHQADKYYIFIEEYMYATQKGHISVLIMDEKGHYETPTKILERPYHLSYPFVFEWDGNHYLIPDTCANSTIEVYKSTSFPHEWQHHINLMENVQAVDSTLFSHGGKWWLFANLRENEGGSTWDELFLFFSDHPLSQDWQPHPQNPIVSDVRSARPAGKIFEYHGNLYRPSQNSSKEYGYGLKINHITTLNESEYQEKEVNALEPKWDRGMKGVHTINYEGQLTIIDGNLRRNKILVSLRDLLKK